MRKGRDRTIYRHKDKKKIIPRSRLFTFLVSILLVLVCTEHSSFAGLTFRLKNRGSDPVLYARLEYGNSGSTWKVDGWYRLNPGDDIHEFEVSNVTVLYAFIKLDENNKLGSIKYEIGGTSAKMPIRIVYVNPNGGFEYSFHRDDPPPNGYVGIPVSTGYKYRTWGRHNQSKYLNATIYPKPSDKLVYFNK